MSLPVRIQPLTWSSPTREPAEWWFTWHPLEDLRHHLAPAAARRIHMSPRSRALVDESVPLRERNYGITHHVVEDTNTLMTGSGFGTFALGQCAEASIEPSAPRSARASGQAGAGRLPLSWPGPVI
ncbi:DAPG hydrolase family protein [Streptomyces sp. CA-132043]|uniref:DAPG hydrolase family protein n=1 Tax=Streptomyces sp. CA-132043 TaxID=3240048 RepID=UPI003D8E9D66